MNDHLNTRGEIKEKVCIGINSDFLYSFANKALIRYLKLFESAGLRLSNFVFTWTAHGSGFELFITF